MARIDDSRSVVCGTLPRGVNGLLLGRKEDHRIGILRNIGADMSLMMLTTTPHGSDLDGRIGISRSITEFTGHRGWSGCGGLWELARRKGIFRSVG